MPSKLDFAFRIDQIIPNEAFNKIASKYIKLFKFPQTFSDGAVT